MANEHVVPPAHFIGRTAAIARLTARLDHFRFFVYEGIAGIGKTALLARLAQACRRPELRRQIYVALGPDEGVGALLARLQVRLRGAAQRDPGAQREPFTPLLELLHAEQVVLLVDNLENLPAVELPPLIRALHRHAGGNFRVLGAMRGDPNLAALDQAQLHLERLGALTAAEAAALAAPFDLGEEQMAVVLADAGRGGALAHPLTCRFVLALGGGTVPSREELSGLSARSLNAFRTLVAPRLHAVPPATRAALTALAGIGAPIARDVAGQVFGSGVAAAIRRGLIDVMDGDVCVHPLVATLLGPPPELPAAALAQVADHLAARCTGRGEPHAALRAAALWGGSGDHERALATLAGCEGWTREPGFREHFRRALAGIPTPDRKDPRRRLLAAQLRLREGASQSVLGELRELAEGSDAWARGRALMASVQIHAAQDRPAEAAAAFAALGDAVPRDAAWLAAGLRAAESLLALDRPAEAEALAAELMAAAEAAPARAAALCWLLAHACAQTGKIAQAVGHAEAAARHFDAAGDLAHAAVAHGFTGDLYRESGDFPQARAAFAAFRAVAARLGDRNLEQLAALGDAWVSLDVGDVAHAAKTVASVEREMGAAPDRRLRRYLAAAQALLEAGRGHHARAAALLGRAVAADHGQPSEASPFVGSLEAQLVRSLIACDRLDEAAARVGAARAGLTAARHGGRLAALLRESALIHLRRGNPELAMRELDEAQALFVSHGNRREAAITLYRIAHAALEEGDRTLARERGRAALALADEIGHTRASALAHELLARLALLDDDAAAALAGAREAIASLRRLGDELGVLHVSETLLRAYLFAGDIASALRLGPRLRDQAGRLEVPELRIRAVAYTGVALLRRDRPDLASRCFRELPRRMAPMTRALMARFGEALALAQGDAAAAVRRRAQWVLAFQKMPATRRPQAVHAVAQLALAPRERCELRVGDQSVQLGTEAARLVDPGAFDLFADLLHRKIYDGGEPVPDLPAPLAKLAMRLMLTHPTPLPWAQVRASLDLPGSQTITPAEAEALRSQAQAGLSAAPHLVLAVSAQGMTMVPPARFACLSPVWVAANLTGSQKEIVKLLRRLGAAPAQAIQEACQLSRGVLRRELGELTRTHVLEAVREGRGQVYRLV